VRKFTLKQKLAALVFRHDSQHMPWKPKVGDYYTIVRTDLKLFQIVREENGNFVFVCNEYEGEYAFPVKGFSDEGFGLNRAHVPDWVFEVEEWKDDHDNKDI
jgi:hypothetical protein